MMDGLALGGDQPRGGDDAPSAMQGKSQKTGEAEG